MATAKKKRASMRAGNTGKAIDTIVTAADVLRDGAAKLPDCWQRDDLLILEKSMRAQSRFVLDAAAVLERRRTRGQ